MRRTLLVLALASVALIASVQQLGVPIQGGFVTGERFLSQTASEQRTYVMGATDGLFLAPLLGAPKDKSVPFEKCIVGMTDTQISAILTKYLREKPEVWHQSVNVHFYEALLAACHISRPGFRGAR